jgi:hypothetical protein
MNSVVEEAIEVLDIASPIEDMEQNIAASEREYQRWSRGMVHMGDGTVHISEETDGMLWVKQMEKVAKRIAAEDECATKIAKIISGSGRYSGLFYELTPLGKAIWELCKEAVPLMEELYPGCRRKEQHQLQSENPTRKAKDIGPPDEMRTKFNPHITVLLRACQTMREMPQCCGRVTLDVNQRAVRAALARHLRFVRRVCRSKEFKYLENNYARNERENLRSCCEYIASTFAKHSKLLIMRVDLYFLPENKKWANTLQASRCVKGFLRALRENRIVPDVKAWICRRENGFRRGIHLHLFVAIDGHKHCEASTFSEIIGEAWVKRFSNGHGSYFNCYIRRKDFKFNGLGLVHISNRAKLMGIREAIKYITKSDCHVTTGYPRNLWKGVMRWSWAVIKRGAPRKLEHDMSLVNEILGYDALR